MKTPYTEGTMGCVSYEVRDSIIRFSEGDDDTGCLCTFPHNYRNHPLSVSTLRSLAMLGAAVAIATNQRGNEEWVYLPHDLPDWVREGIDNHLPREDR